MSNNIRFLGVFLLLLVFSQSQARPAGNSYAKNSLTTYSENDSIQKGNVPDGNLDIPRLIPKKKNGKFGYVNQTGKFIIQPEYHIAVFFSEDCNLLNSSNEKAREFGTKDYATVEKNMISYRIDQTGKRVYQYKDEDLGICKSEYKKQQFQAYVANGFYGIVEEAKFMNPDDPSQYRIYPKYQYLHVMEGDNIGNPMVVASMNDKFGVIDVNNNIIIPFEYSDIKRNYSWKLGKMFEVTKDGKNYYYIDANNKAY
ncbi:WG repeat-containing protein [Chryseobacterium sp. CT-SW4]|uniref:WG repeat-containing protein n=1 Tax=Chryseobacterium sp. SW-1 TaxID=3157343 RepID=UPI003B024F65